MNEPRLMHVEKIDVAVKMQQKNRCGEKQVSSGNEDAVGEYSE